MSLAQVLAWEISSLVLILNESAEQSQRWPFMLDYIAIDFPPLNDPLKRGRWSTGGLVSWLSLNAMVSVLTQVCHSLSVLTIIETDFFFKSLRTSSFSLSCILPALRVNSSFSSLGPSP